MICTKNGVTAHLDEYGLAVQTDRYDLGNGDLLLRTTARKFEVASEDYDLGTGNDIVVHRIEHWFDEHRDYGVMLVRDGDWS